MKTILVLVVVVVLVLLVRGWLDRPVHHKRILLNELPRFFEDFYSRAFDGAILMITCASPVKFIQFRKYTDHGTEYLEFAFPDAPWSRSYFPRVLSTFTSRGIPFQVEDTGRDDTRALLTVSGIRDPKEAFVVSLAALQSIGEDGHAVFSVHATGPITARSTKESS